jgi:hypothetical protein
VLFNFGDSKMNKDQIEKLIDDANLSSTASFRIREWFAQNTLVSTETKVVGLNDSQVKALGKVIHQKSMNLTLFEAETLVESWLKTQTFSQQMRCIDWDNAPDDAVNAVVFVQFYNKDNVSIRCCDTLGKFERPTPPATRVEVGQVWDFHGSSVEIVMVTEFQIVMKSIETGNLSIDDDIDDFIEKFRRLQP